MLCDLLYGLKDEKVFQNDKVILKLGEPAVF